MTVARFTLAFASLLLASGACFAQETVVRYSPLTGEAQVVVESAPPRTTYVSPERTTYRSTIHYRTTPRTSCEPAPSACAPAPRVVHSSCSCCGPRAVVVQPQPTTRVYVQPRRTHVYVNPYRRTYVRPRVYVQPPRVVVRPRHYYPRVTPVPAYPRVRPVYRPHHSARVVVPVPPHHAYVARKTAKQARRTGRQIDAEAHRAGRRVNKEASRVGRRVGKEASRAGKRIGKEASRLFKKIF